MHSTFIKLAASSRRWPSAPRPCTPQARPSLPSRSSWWCPMSPGGLPDTVARILSQRLQASLGQPVVVENKPGAGGAVAAAAIAQSPADGHTLLVTDGPMLAITPLLSSKPAYDATKDFVPVSLVGHRAAVPGGQPERQGQHARRTDRAGQDQARRAQLRLGGHRQHSPSDRRGDEGRPGHLHHAHPVPRQRRLGAGDDRRPGRHGVRLAAVADGLRQVGPGAS